MIVGLVGEAVVIVQDFRLLIPPLFLSPDNILLGSLLRCLMILQPPGERPTLYTNVHATSTSLVKKYLLNNSVRQNKVRTQFDPENLPTSAKIIPCVPCVPCV